MGVFLFCFVLHAIAPNKIMQQEESVCYIEFLFIGKIYSLFTKLYRNEYSIVTLVLSYFQILFLNILFEMKITKCTAKII